MKAINDANRNPVGWVLSGRNLKVKRRPPSVASAWFSLTMTLKSIDLHFVSYAVMMDA